MGVKGLWRLLLPIGRRISIETLSGKILAIDASIWLTQFLKVAKRIADAEGEGHGNNGVATAGSAAAPHLAGFFRRLCRLAYHNIRPVFVFDGVMPEIKRREIRARQRRRKEQFAKQSTVAVQRLAKKLLTEQIKHAKHSNKGRNNTGSGGSDKNPPGAFDEHFNPPEESETPGAADQNETAAASVEEDKEKNESGATTGEGVVEVAEGEGTSVIDLTSTQGETHANAATEDQQNDDDDDDDDDHGKSDWDRPVDEKFDEDDNEEEGSALPVSESHHEQHLTAHYISSLPSSKRKDAIEKAQRSLRLASRREFMPAAANAGQFSQVQLSNFLKFSRFNRSMEEMAKSAVSRSRRGQQQQRGDVMASDRNTRIELIHEDEDEEKGEGGEIPKRLKRLRQASSNNTNENNDGEEQADSDREDLWLEGEDQKDDGLPFRASSNLNGPPPPAGAVTRKRKRRIIQDDEGDDDGDPPLDGAGGFFVQSPSLLAKSPQAPDTHSDNDGGGGFLKHDDTSDNNNNNNNDDDAGGGFFHTVESKQGSGESGFLKQMTAQDSKDCCGGGVQQDAYNDWGGGGFLPSRQARECAPSKAAQPVASAAAKIDLTGSDKEDANDEETKDNRHNPFGSGGNRSNSASAEDRKVPAAGHLQERDAECAQELADRVLAQALQDAEDAEAVDMDDAISANRAVARGLKYDSSILIERADAKFEGNVDSSDEDEVDWEEGEEENSMDNQLSPPPESRASMRDGKDIENQELSLIDREGCASPCAQGDIDSRYRDDTSDGERVDDVESQSEDMADETAEALDRAQETASRLANWAGRAFRRVMKEVNDDPKVSPQKEAQGVHKQEQADGTWNNGTIGSSEDNRKPAARTQPFNRNERGSLTSNPASESTNNTQAGISAALNSTLGERGNSSTFGEERNKRDGDMDGVTDEMMEEIQQLLRLFGVPYVEAPAEAEAQCAALEALGLVHGIVTEDSDVFVFGGKAVYKNIFEEKHYVEAYLAPDAEKEMSLGRNEMVALAVLLGGDYTEGVRGVGIVNAMEVLEAFDMSKGTKEGLKTFKSWLDGIDLLDKKKSDSPEIRRFHEKHRSARTSWTYPESFPSDNVLHAYLHPVVDKSSGKFSWGAPDVVELINFCNRTMGWRPEETKRYLDPIAQKANDGYRQTRIDSFMRYEDSIKFADVRSKRLRDVLGLSSKNESEGLNEKKSAPRKKKLRTKK